jgi:hypothetical protein
MLRTIAIDVLDNPPEQVRRIQNFLGLPETGFYEDLDEQAVKRFQDKEGLVKDGVVGPHTWAALLRAPCEVSQIDDAVWRCIDSIPYPELRPFAIESIPLILYECEGAGFCWEQTAYVLATAEHESRLGEWMVEFASGWEYEGRSDLGNTQIGDGPRFKGRGFVQLTGRANYADWSERLGIDLVANPEKLVQPTLAAHILVQGMKLGTFTGHKLGQYVNATHHDYVNARRCINWLDRAEHIAAIAEEYRKCL